MNIRTLILLILVPIATTACGFFSSDFEMSVDKVEKLEGVILKGLAVSGEIKSGCIKNEDEYSVQRDGKSLLKENARILKIEGKDKFDPQTVEAGKGDVVSFYIPDAAADAVKTGDVVVSGTTSCK